MARPIKETPTLRGKDARVFEDRMKKPRPVSQAEIHAAREVYNSIMSSSKVMF